MADLIRKGLNTREIAGELKVKTSTIEFYRNSIREKLGIRNHKVRLKTHLQGEGTFMKLFLSRLCLNMP